MIESNQHSAQLIKMPKNFSESEVISKKPSKLELKNVIASLKKGDGNNLLTVKKALKYIRFYMKSEGLTNKLLKEIIKHWAESSEKVRVICLLCIVRIFTKIKDKTRRQDLVKSLYTSFLEKCKITKRDTMSMISFMRHSIIEIYRLDSQLALKQAQNACAQLTSTLKNATIHKNEDSYRAVMNWQYANCLILFSDLMIAFCDDISYKKLTNQFIELNIGALNLFSSPRYYPFYCHLIDNLINISAATGLFIPVLPTLIDILTRIKQPKESTKNKKQNEDEENSDQEEDEHQQKEYNLDLLNHVSLEEAHSESYQKAVLNQISELLVKYLSSQRHKISFPELTLIARVHIKKWVKNNFRISSTFKSILQKIEEDGFRIEKKRSNVEFAFDNLPAVDAWEREMKIHVS